MTYDLGLQFQPSLGQGRPLCQKSRSKVKRFKQESSDRHTHERTDRRTDGRYQVHYLPASRSIKIIETKSLDPDLLRVSKMLTGDFCFAPKLSLGLHKFRIFFSQKVALQNFVLKGHHTNPDLVSRHEGHSLCVSELSSLARGGTIYFRWPIINICMQKKKGSAPFAYWSLTSPYHTGDERTQLPHITNGKIVVTPLLVP